jgi:hypothetical protein
MIEWIPFLHSILVCFKSYPGTIPSPTKCICLDRNHSWFQIAKQLKRSKQRQEGTSVLNSDASNHHPASSVCFNYHHTLTMDLRDSSKLLLYRKKKRKVIYSGIRFSSRSSSESETSSSGSSKAPTSAKYVLCSFTKSAPSQSLLGALGGGRFCLKHCKQPEVWTSVQTNFIGKSDYLKSLSKHTLLSIRNLNFAVIN